MCDIPPCARAGCGHDFARHEHYSGEGVEWCSTPRCLCREYKRPRRGLVERLHVLWLRLAG